MNAALKSKALNTNAGLAQAIACLGSQKALASVLRVTPQMVSQLVNDQLIIDPRHCPAIEEATGGKVKVEQLRPDLLWIRNRDHGYPMGYLTTIGLTPEDAKEQLFAWARERADAEVLTYLPAEFLQAGAATLPEGQTFNGMNLEYTPRDSNAAASDVIADALKLMDGASHILHQHPPAKCDDDEGETDAIVYGAFHLYDIAASALRAAQKLMPTSGHSVRCRQNFIEGMLYRASEELKADFEKQHGNLDELVAAGLDDTAWLHLVELLSDAIGDEKCEFDLAYGHAFGIMHRLSKDGEDELVDQLIRKHGFDKDPARSNLTVTNRLDNLDAEVQSILAKRADPGDRAAAPQANPLEFTYIGDWAQRQHGLYAEWSPSDAANLTVRRCLDDASCLLTEANSVFLAVDEMSNEHSAGARLFNMAHVLVELAHTKLLRGRSKEDAR